MTDGTDDVPWAGVVLGSALVVSGFGLMWYWFFVRPKKAGMGPKDTDILPPGKTSGPGPIGIEPALPGSSVDTKPGDEVCVDPSIGPTEEDVRFLWGQAGLVQLVETLCCRRIWKFTHAGPPLTNLPKGTVQYATSGKGGARAGVLIYNTLAEAEALARTNCMMA